MARNDRHSLSQRDASAVTDHRYNDREKRFSSTFLIVLVSLLFVAVFGGALVGGVVSGDPSNGFFITIIAASGVAIGVAAVVSLRYCYHQRGDRAQSDYGLKENTTQEIRGTLTRSVEEDEELGYYDNRGRYYPTQGRVEEKIQEVAAPSMAPGDISAMSPTTYDLDTYTQTASHFSRREYNGHGHRLRINQRPDVEERRGPFDFDEVNDTLYRQEIPFREDPPEDNAGCNLYCGMPMSRDPTAAIATADGNLLVDEASDVDVVSPAARSQSSGRSERSRYDVPEHEDNVAESRNREKEIQTHAIRSERKRDRNSKDDIPPPPPPPPRSTRAASSSSSVRDIPRTKTAPGTPTASDAGTAVSSVILKHFAGMFGKKRTPSEAGYSDTSSNIKGSEVNASNSGNLSKVPDVRAGSDNNPSAKEGRPPMPGRKPSHKRTDLTNTGRNVNDDRYNPSTPGKHSAFNVPPPRRVPDTPGSEAPSEFRSMAGSSVFSNGVASSTFDPRAHDRAVQRNQRNTSALGANFNDMPIYYDEDESAIQSAAPSIQSAAPSETTARSIGYDVFAPPGPIGMVVDTIDKGCVVHSLKKTSPMQGLINPGDLIVALDDVDVRKLDAASLTKLMAKKSQQRERKFTLIPADQY